MDALVVATLAFALGAIVGGLAGIHFVAGNIGRQLKADMAAGRVTPDQAKRIAEMPDARR